MTLPLHEVEAQALALPAGEREQLLVRLAESLEAEPAGDSATVSAAWDEEIARRIADLDAGVTESVPYEVVRAELRAMIENHRKP